MDKSAITLTYKNKLLNPLLWKETSVDLLDSAKLFEQNINEYWKSNSKQKYKKYLKTYMMLVAYALENLFKGIIVADNRDSFMAGIESKFPEDLKSHKLLDLAEKAGLSTDDNDKDYLGRLSRMSVWEGRYPVPLNADNLPGKNASGLSDKFIARDYFSRDDVAKGYDLFRRGLLIFEKKDLSEVMHKTF
ncbi:hypothetical protein ACFLS1_10895 [Verrucomicrobiota bacterium]